METTLLKGYVVCLLKTDYLSIGQRIAFDKKSNIHHPTIEEAEAAIPESGYDTYTILPVYRRIKTEAK